MLLITALMSTYNSAHHVKETIESILSQTYPNFEFLIIDDGSTDNTVETIQQYNDQRIRLIQNKENKGVGACLNQALEFIHTPYIAKVDSDDISHPERFAKQLQYMKDNPELDIIKSYFEYFPDTSEVEQSERYKQYKAVKEKEHNAIDTPELIKKNLPRWLCVVHAIYFGKTSVIRSVNYPKTRYAEDYHLFLKAVQASHHIGCIQEHLVKVRISDYSVTTKSDTAKIYTQSIIDLKIDEVDTLHNKNKGLWIYGTGGLGKESCSYLVSMGYKVHGFLDKTEGSVEVLNQVYPVAFLREDTPKGIVVAAQPVRSMMLNKLIQMGWQEWQDFIILA